MLSSAQLTAIKAYILGDATLAAYASSGAHNVVAIELNKTASPAYVVWRTALSRTQLYDAMNWSTYIARSQGERDAFNALLANDQVNPSLASVRQAFADIFSGGTSQAINLRAALNSAGQRNATIAEKVLSFGGDGSTTTPSTMGFEGFIDADDVSLAMAS